MSDTLLSAKEDVDQFFRLVHGRRLPTLSETYPLPVDTDEEKRQELHHRQMQFVFSGKNWVGPVKEALQFGEKRRILDLGTGKGYWAIEMADEFPRADVIGIDIAPIQPEYVPPNCQFEICNLDEPSQLPYADESFDLIHARSVHIGLQDYPGLVDEIGRLLKPGGLVLLVEPDLFPAATGRPTPSQSGSGVSQHAPGPHNANTAVCGGSNRTDVTPVQGSSAASSSTSHTSPQRPDNHTAVLHSLPGAPSSPRPSHHAHPIWRSPTTNRHHLDFILNHAPESPLARAATLPNRHPDPKPSSQNPPSNSGLSTVDGPTIPSTPPPTTMRGWSKLWSTFRSCLKDRPRSIDVTVPSHLGEILASSGSFQDIVVKQANVPVGFWPQDSTMLTIGQLQWMDYELLIPALQPFFLSSGIPPEEVSRIVQDAQHDLYYPAVPFFAHIHIAYATKRRD